VGRCKYLAVLVTPLVPAIAAAETSAVSEQTVPTAEPTFLVQVDGVASDIDGYSTINLRRGRFGLEGELTAFLSYAVNVELGGAKGDERGRLNTLWLQYEGIARLRIRAGLLSPSQPFEGSTSALLFPERAAPASIQRSLAGGTSAKAVAAYANGARWTASAALSGGPIYETSGRSAIAANARVSALPRAAEPLLHVGVNATFGIRSEDDKFQFSERGESRSTQRKLSDTGGQIGSGASAYGLEFGAQWRQFSIQSEVYRFDISRRGKADPTFWGGYVLASWTITGEPRRYLVSSGNFDSIQPRRPLNLRRGHWGALEVAARLSRLDLNSGDIFGGEQGIGSVTLNWYPSGIFRVQLGAQKLRSRRQHTAPTDFRLFTVRTQFSL
jgi:phosphate-selective porin OprO/OprP